MFFFIISKWILLWYIVISCAGTLLSEKETVQIFGTSKGFVASATHILKGTTFDLYKSLDLEDAAKVASCDYEYSTAWGKQVRNLNSLLIMQHG